jgi:hypothetical protein
MVEEKKAPAKSKEDSLRADIDKAAKRLDEAKEEHLAAGVALEEAKVKFYEFRGDESEKSQVAQTR